MQASNVRVVVGDAAEWTGPEEFDRVLVDPPCSGLGTLQSRPDLRWRASPEAIAELVDEQRAVLAAAARATRPGGSLTYSVCTISRAEAEGQIEWFGEQQRGFVPEESLQLLPHRDGTDGFFIARLRREAD
jgi:16S rRNA (cytosine967-C5)-methyltransferase